MSSIRPRFASAAVALAFALSSFLVAQEPVPSRWQSKFVANPELPANFRQLALPRPDGTMATAYLCNFKKSLQQGRKPLLIYLEGSGAQSLFVRVGDRVGMGIFGLIGEKAGKRFHVAALDKRGVGFAQAVARRGSAIGASAEYQAHATLSSRVAEVRLLIEKLSAEPLVDASKIVLVGHSEGADVAARVAEVDDRVTHVAFLSGGGACQFYDFFIGQRRQQQKAGKSPAEIAEAMGELQKKVREILAAPEDTEKMWLGHAYKRWASFAVHAPADSLAKTKAKVFVAQGSEDRSVPVESFDYLVTQLLIHKPGAKIRRYPGRDHSFISKGSKPGYEGFLEVIREVLAWVR